MTRTARSASLKALTRDRSESKTGNRDQLRKGGAGQHNWGSVRDEGQYEDDAQYDEAEEGDAVPDSHVKANKPENIRRASDEDIATAKQFRKHALGKNGIDLSDIARTSAAVSASPTDSNSSISIASNTAV